MLSRRVLWVIQGLTALAVASVTFLYPLGVTWGVVAFSVTMLCVVAIEEILKASRADTAGQHRDQG